VKFEISVKVVNQYPDRLKLWQSLSNFQGVCLKCLTNSYFWYFYFLKELLTNIKNYDFEIFKYG